MCLNVIEAVALFDESVPHSGLAGHNGLFLSLGNDRDGDSAINCDFRMIVDLFQRIFILAV